MITDDDYVAVFMSEGKGKLASVVRASAGKPWGIVAGDLTGQKVQSLVVVGAPSGDEEKSRLYVLPATCR